MIQPEATVPFWDRVSALQKQANRRKLDHRSWVDEERLDKLLMRPTHMDVKADELAACERSRHNLAKKYFHRAKVDQKLSRERAAPDQYERIDQHDDVAARLKFITKADGELLLALANGRTYRELASDLGEPTGTLKARVSRLRRQLRDQPRPGGHARSATKRTLQTKQDHGPET